MGGWREVGEEVGCSPVIHMFAGCHHRHSKCSHLGGLPEMLDEGGGRERGWKMGKWRRRSRIPTTYPPLPPTSPHPPLPSCLLIRSISSSSSRVDKNKDALARLSSSKFSRFTTSRQVSNHQERVIESFDLFSRTVTVNKKL